MFFVILFLGFKKKLGGDLNPELEFFPRLKALFAEDVVIFIGFDCHSGEFVNLLNFEILINELTQIHLKLFSTTNYCLKYLQAI